MGTPFNDQWVLLRSSRRRRSERAPSHPHRHLEPAPTIAPGTQDERPTPPAGIRRRARRTRWIDRDT
ncbi:MAG TPA: hypothetical protein VLX08_12215 [Steroidobacteraceae bacterium]|nr:hypothetical protein [Steroidobacteraceae bacterium]